MTAMGGDAPVRQAAERCVAVEQAWAWVAEMAVLETGVGHDRDRIELLSALEAVKAASAAVQARVTADFVESQMAAALELADAERSAVGIVSSELHPSLVRRSVCAQVALARREAPDRGAVLVNLAEALTSDLPATMAALTAGVTSEYRALLVHRETGCLSPGLRREADVALEEALPRLGNRQVGERAREQALRLDPGAAKRRIRAAVGGRRVTLRRAPDAMAYLTALLPAGAATVCLRSLEREAEATIAAAPGRSGGSDGSGEADGPGRRCRGAVMADAFVERLTQGLVAGCDEHGAPTGNPGGPTDQDLTDAGHGTGPADGQAWTDAGAAAEAHAGGDGGSGASAEQPGDDSDGSLDLLVHLVMTDRTMFGVDEEPAQLIGYGPIPAELARRMVAAELGPKARTWIKRLFTAPESGRLAAMDSRSRFFPDSLKQFLLVRDRQCRMPYCGAPARHADHTVPHARGGPTSAGNGECTSVNCNMVKEAHGWSAGPAADGTITVQTPTGHRYRSDEPRPPRSPRWDTAPQDRVTGTAAVDPDTAAAPGAPPMSGARPAEWERMLDAALAGAEDSDPASRRDPESLPNPARPDRDDLPPGTATVPRPGTTLRSGTTLRRKVSRDDPGRKRGRRPRPPTRSRPQPIDPGIARRRLDLLSQIRQVPGPVSSQ